MASQKTRDKHAKKRREQWDNGGAYELTAEEKERIAASNLAWKKQKKGRSFRPKPSNASIAAGLEKAEEEPRRNVEPKKAKKAS